MRWDLDKKEKFREESLFPPLSSLKSKIDIAFLL
jgi:hypothetical protein